MICVRFTLFNGSCLNATLGVENGRGYDWGTGLVNSYSTTIFCMISLIWWWLSPSHGCTITKISSHPSGISSLWVLKGMGPKWYGWYLRRISTRSCGGSKTSFRCIWVESSLSSPCNRSGSITSARSLSLICSLSVALSLLSGWSTRTSWHTSLYICSLQAWEHLSGLGGCRSWGHVNCWSVFQVQASVSSIASSWILLSPPTISKENQDTS